MLESEGVQIFVFTHDYFLSKYIEVKRGEDSEVQYISLYKDENDKVQCEAEREFELLEHNAIMDTLRQLYREEVGGTEVKIILESKMNFWEFDEDNLFHIEASELYKSIGAGIKTVELILNICTMEWNIM